jgi:Ca2+-binding EF-hand superfamily protein
MNSPSKLKQSFTAADEEDENISQQTMRSQTEPPLSPKTRGVQASPAAANTFSMSTASARDHRSFNSPNAASSDNLSKLPPQLLHSMREAFSVLDHNNTGSISQSDVNETLSSLGISDSSQFFPPGSPQQVSLPQFLDQIAAILVELSPQQELLNAFSAFDDDDSGQVDVVELRDALLHTAPNPGDKALTERDVDAVLGANGGFTGRRVFARNAVGIAGVKGLNGSSGGKKNGDVFRYQEFVGNLTCGGNGHHSGGAEGVKAA